MRKLTTAQHRRWAHDMALAWAGTDLEHKAEAHATRMIAEADLEDCRAGVPPQMADTVSMEYYYPILGRTVIRPDRTRIPEHLYDDALADYCETRGIYTAWEWRTDPAAEERCGELVYLRIGSRARGPEAQYTADTETWYALTGKGDHGKRYAHGGTWTSRKCTKETPNIVKKLEELIVRYNKIKQAEARLKAANLRVLAAQQAEMAAAYHRQSSRPAYPGQEMICAGKAQIVEALSAQTMARANFIEADL